MQNQAKADSYVDLSRLFIYYNARALTGAEREDAGAYLRDALTAANKHGICTELLWPYRVKNFDTRPSEACYQDGQQRIITNYRKVPGVPTMLDALNDNRPVIFGITIYNGFDELKGKDSILRTPLNNDNDLGGHAMCMVGYDTNRQLFLAKNSFGTDWGDEGYCWIPFDYMRSEGYDMWTFDIA